MFTSKVWKDFVELIDDGEGRKLSLLCESDDDTLQFVTNVKEDNVLMHNITNTFTVPWAGANQHTKISLLVYWLKKSSDEDINIKLNILYNKYGKIIKLANDIEVSALVDRIEVELQEDSFKSLMQNVVEESAIGTQPSHFGNPSK
ncbi:hypothetical protein AXG93_1757s1060 [Marchantia polymorpha subsp. ruderalis]|uniref:Uncharacterized protein n=1 Tax=Marchantia polymorpha subsp. ruderalis TaxID=1480154 RepID=A0A176WMC8_MARPO|nr:hypothetical protein AXG93_1757s1060 [Marchantia polymorpha subsp. ruderalis]